MSYDDKDENKARSIPAESKGREIKHIRRASGGVMGYRNFIS